MKIKHVFSPRMLFLFVISVLFQLVSVSSTYGAERKILYLSEGSNALREIANFLKSPDKKTECSSMAKQRTYFARIAPTQYIVSEDNSLKDDAILGTKPYVFVTTPEEICGKSLLDIYLDIGYEAEDIVRWQKNVDMVAVVFRYPPEIVYSDVKDGVLPEGWRNHIHSPTWDNIFSIFSKLASEATIEPDKKGEFSPERMFFRNKQEQSFVLNFPKEAQEQIKKASYTGLQANGGTNWDYRKLLENKLSIFEHFRGNGRTINEVVDPDGKERSTGILEFVSPNRKVKSLPEVAVIHLGRLQMDDTYSGK